MNITKIETSTHENVVKFEDEESGLEAIIAIHSTTRGPALGGTRFWTYETSEDLLTDALLLSEAMTYKNAAAELPYGGGKAVINLKNATKTYALLLAYGEAVEYMNGTYITAEDVGCAPNDLNVISEVTKHCASGKVTSSPATALGVYTSLLAALEFNGEFNGESKISDCAVLVQGVGNVGSFLAEILVKAGAEVYVHDIDHDRVQRLMNRLPEVKSIFTKLLLAETKKTIKVFAPCALGPVVTMENKFNMLDTYDIICGAANNVVEKGVEADLTNAGVIYCPDFVTNAGGVISIHHDLIGTTDQMLVAADVVKIHTRIHDILRTSGKSTMEVAYDFAKERLGV